MSHHHGHHPPALAPVDVSTDEEVTPKLHTTFSTEFAASWAGAPVEDPFARKRQPWDNSPHGIPSPGMLLPDDPLSPTTKMNRLRRLAGAVRNKFKDLEKAHKSFDLDGDGEVTKREFKTGLLDLLVLGVEPDDVDLMVETADEDKNGIIEFDEFVKLMSSLHQDVEEDVRTMIKARYGSAERAFTEWSEGAQLLFESKFTKGMNSLDLGLTEFQVLFLFREIRDAGTDVDRIQPGPFIAHFGV
mmetsp:Transcript_29733/g.68859  ORF Transcript_29733/g.68859 Transcript_29733/m.68859 type:complete len:244 (+) Transcript_29733:98-829(+)|eukprot:CAMPEP_0114547482 /NCGR_PEP_ID=MMETSP0114-20121206/4487_1 /TAXON_ID=31324 /ORGANISM="Goniomonas sp, Strain m" /LENGTH=243 /DNA_ID=CAMNT_0001732039 /DNA_START=94 /DNA_END=825 /DNA_ORIENTATION=+